MTPGILKNGQAKETAGAATDLDEHARIYEELLRSEERLRVLVENSSDLVALVDGAGIFEFQSPSSEPILGYRPEELVGRSAFDFIHPDDAGVTQRRLAELAQGRRDPSQSTELRFQHKDGSWRVLETKARKLPSPAGKVSYALNSRDVTERKQIEQSLRLTQCSVERAADQIQWLDPQGRVLFANEASCRRDGYSREEMLSMRIFDLDPTLSPDSWPGVWQRLKEAGSVTVESVHRAKSGELYPVEISANYVEEDEKEYDFVFARDITERKRTEQSLKLTQFSVDHAADMVSWMSPEGRFVYANDTICRRLGYERGELVGLTIYDVDPQAPRPWEEHWQELKRRGSLTFETVHRTKSGDIFPVEVTTNYVEFEGHEYNLPFARDISERKKAEVELRESEERLRLALVASNQGMWDLDLRSGQTLVSPHYALMLGYEPDEFQLTLEDFRASLHPEDRERVAAASEAYLRGDRPTYEAQYRRRTRSGDWKWFSTLGMVTERDEAGEPLRMVGTQSDITERKQAEEALALAEEQLRQAQKMEAVGQLAGGIAHDFNNLLTSIIGNSSLALAAMPLEDPNRELVADIQEVGQRAAGLTKQILAFSRRQILEPQIVQLNDIALTMEPLLRRTLGEDIDLHFSLAPDLKETEVDPHQMEQVLMNLALNARDALAGGGHLTVETANTKLDRIYARTHLEVAPGWYVMLAVSDTGCGMDAETKSCVFEPFFTTKEVGKGTGLGLSTVFGIVRQSGGSISVYSEPGEGSTFKVYLPVSQTAAAPKEDCPPERDVEKGTETILLVEDEAPVRKLVARVLSRAGYEVFQAGSIRGVDTALGKAVRPPDLLLTDMVLPRGGNGREVAEMLRERHPGLKVLYMSGYTRDSIVHDGRLDEGIEFLEKPFTPETLLQKVRLVLDARPTAKREA